MSCKILNFQGSAGKMLNYQSFVGKILNVLHFAGKILYFQHRDLTNGGQVKHGPYLSRKENFDHQSFSVTRFLKTSPFHERNFFVSSIERLE